jgi:dTDP-4-amino-4,6-dideoxygalactose transaminase
VFCDIRGDGDLNLDAADVEAAMTPATKIVLVLHYAGFPAETTKILDLARSRGVAVIEDAAHAPGSVADDGGMCGTLGAAGCFSFFANKNIPVGEGGMIVTSDPELDARLRLLRSHGMTTLTWDRERGHASTYDVVLAGFNYRLDEVRAAIGLVQLARTRAENSTRAAIAQRYRDAFASVDGLMLAFEESVGDPRFAHHLAVVIADSAEGARRLRSHLAERRIQTSAHYPPIHRFSRYEELGRRRKLLRTDDVADRLVTLPLYAHMTDDQVNLVIDSVRSAYAP